MMEVKDLSHCDVWTGMYRGIFIKIHRHMQKGMDEYQIRDKEIWCYYLSFNKDRLNESIFNAVTAGIKENDYFSCNYSDSPLYNLNWHHGCTFGKLIRNKDAELHVMELGCDYNHYWDEGNYYTLESVLDDCKKTVDEFHEIYPNAMKQKEAA